ncbi:adenosine deaminase [Planktotalea sp.]|uniref:adenosine deaminase n=1 Tax=Planktotalea sp. TaxID=2029877 RepID=UPI0032988228
MNEMSEELAGILDLPKIELHTHYEGAAPPAFIRGLAQEKNVDISKVFNADGSYAFKDFVHFLSVYEAATTVLKSPEDFKRLGLAILEEAASNGVIYMESFISPDFCGGGDVDAWRDYLAAMEEAATEAERDFGITSRGIVTCIRHFGPEQAKTAALCAAETAGGFITGFGMGGDENQGNQRDFAYSYDMAREAGLKLTTHAGEWRGPQEVRDAVNDLRVERIGHGVRAAEDAALVDELAEKGVVLEVCPGSNVVLGVYPDWKSHPIDVLRRAGVKVTVSTDDPPFFHTNMRNEYLNLANTFGWDAEVFTEIAKASANAAFCDEDTRTQILKKLEA